MMIKKTAAVLSVICFSFFVSCSFLDCPFSCYIDHAATDAGYVPGSHSVTVYYYLINKGEVILTGATITIEADDTNGNSFDETILPKMLLPGDIYNGTLGISLSFYDYEPGSALITGWECDEF